MRYFTFFAGAALVATTSSAMAQEAVRIAVLPTQFEESARNKVPRLFDEYLLTAVQNAGNFEVIGQDDINAMLGFEEQRDLMGCDDASCIADIGGALGVDRIIAVKVARIDQDWVVASKLINIRSTRVDARSSDFVRGDTRALLQAVPDVVRTLFSRADLEASPATQRHTQSSRAEDQRPLDSVSVTPNESVGRGARMTGLILTIAGLGVAVVGGIVTIAGAASCEYCSTDEVLVPIIYGGLVYGAGLVLAGIGSGVNLNGRARGTTGDASASGHWGLRWLGWVLTPVSVVMPWLFAAADAEALAYLSGVGGLVGAGVVFGLSLVAGYARTSAGVEMPMAMLPTLMPDGRGNYDPGLAVAIRF